MARRARTTRAAVPPEEILELAPAQLRPLAEAARRLIRELVPDVHEAGRIGWNLIGYRRRGYFAFLAVQRNELRLGFEHGVLLQDPERRLEGSGKQVRYVTLRSQAELDDPAVRELIRAAVAFDELR